MRPSSRWTVASCGNIAAACSGFGARAAQVLADERVLGAEPRAPPAAPPSSRDRPWRIPDPPAGSRPRFQARTAFSRPRSPSAPCRSRGSAHPQPVEQRKQLPFRRQQIDPPRVPFPRRRQLRHDAEVGDPFLDAGPLIDAARPSMRIASVRIRTASAGTVTVSSPKEKKPSCQLIISKTTSSIWNRIWRSSSRAEIAPRSTRI